MNDFNDIRFLEANISGNVKTVLLKTLTAEKFDGRHMGCHPFC